MTGFVLNNDESISLEPFKGSLYSELLGVYFVGTSISKRWGSVKFEGDFKKTRLF
jgi:hypothetical protein